MTKTKNDTAPVLGTRAVLRDVLAGSRDQCSFKRCPYPRKEILWSARRRVRYVIANIYEGEKWDRLELFHDECYLKARKPYGKLI
jgi:hypothetical protein